MSEPRPSLAAADDLMRKRLHTLIRSMLVIDDPWKGVPRERIQQITREEADRVRAVGGSSRGAVEPIRRRLRAERDGIQT